MMNESELAVFENSAVQTTPRAGMERLEKIVYLLDDLIRIPVINKRIGLDPVIGLIPGAGDAVTALLGMYIIGSAFYYRLPKVVLVRMGINVIFDALVGMIPWVGDASDFFIKSNRWNLNLLREHADLNRRPGWSDYLFVSFVLALVALVLLACLALAGFTLYAGYNLFRSVSLF
ncbi:MAG: DUF4112 domain-containing protein [Blastocatellia bacterium]